MIIFLAHAPELVNELKVQNLDLESHPTSLHFHGLLSDLNKTKTKAKVLQETLINRALRLLASNFQMIAKADPH